MDDCWQLISTYIPKGSWMSFIFTCKKFNSFNTPNVVKERKFNIYEKAFQVSSEWNWTELSKNVPIFKIEQNPDEDWDWKMLLNLY